MASVINLKFVEMQPHFNTIPYLSNGIKIYIFWRWILRRLIPDNYDHSSLVLSLRTWLEYFRGAYTSLKNVYLSIF